MSKQDSYRDYLWSSGLAEATVKLLLALTERVAIDDVDKLMKDYFGSIRDPAWDEISLLNQSGESLRSQNLILQSRLAELCREYAQLQATLLTKRLVELVSPGTSSSDITRKQLLLTLSVSGGKQPNPELATILPETLTAATLSGFLEYSSHAREVASGWFSQDDGSFKLWSNDQVPEELRQFWTDFRDYSTTIPS